MSGDPQEPPADHDVVPDVKPLDTLTATERDVARRLGLGDTCAEIAKARSCSVKTIDTHHGHVLRKLGCSNAVKLAHLLIAWGEIEVRP